MKLVYAFDTRLLFLVAKIFSSNELGLCIKLTVVSELFRSGPIFLLF